MRPFEFYCVGRIIFGRGQFARIGELAARFGRTALAVVNGCEPGDGNPADRLADLLAAAGARCVFLRQRGEPTVADVDRGAELARREGCEVIIGLGGGSAIDAAKAVAGVLTNGGAALDYMEVVGAGKKIARPAVPWIAVPTTAGTGAEATRNAVIACPEKRFKASIRSERLLASIALVDAELGVGVPPDVTARSGMDALCQLIESYTSTGAGPMTDALAMEGLRLAARSLLRAHADGADLDAREEMAMAALLSGIALTNAGLGAVHGLAAPLGANFPAPHGSVCAALLPHVMAANVAALRAPGSAHPALARYAAVGRAMAGRPDLADSQAVDEAIRSVAALVDRLNIPGLGRFGFNERDIPGIVALARKSSSMRYNPVELSDEAVAGALRAAIE